MFASESSPFIFPKVLLHPVMSSLPVVCPVHQLGELQIETHVEVEGSNSDSNSTSTSTSNPTDSDD